MTDTLWIVALAALFVVGCAACYWLGWCARGEHERDCEAERGRIRRGLERAR